MYFPQNLMKIMTEHRLTRYALAKELGCHPSTVSYWLEGSTDPSRKYKKRIAEKYGYREDSLDTAELVPLPAGQSCPVPVAAADWGSWLEELSREELLTLLSLVTERLRSL